MLCCTIKLDKCQRMFYSTFIDVVKQNDQCPHALHILIYTGSLINVLKAFLITSLVLTSTNKDDGFLA